MLVVIRLTFHWVQLHSSDHTTKETKGKFSHIFKDTRLTVDAQLLHRRTAVRLPVFGNRESNG